MKISTANFHSILPKTIINQIPSQIKGNSRDSISCRENDDALIIFNEVKNRLINVNNWYNFTSITNLHFQLSDINKNPIERFALKNDLIKIEFLKDKKSRILKIIMNDWVVVDEIMEIENQEYQCFILRLKPYQSSSKREIKHFYNSEASNTFILYQKENLVILSIHGRNEYPNFKSNSKFHLFRNIMMANLGLIGVDRFLWDNFAENILNTQNNEEI